MDEVVSQCVKKVVSDSLGLVDFAIGLVISILNLPNMQMNFFGGGISNHRRTVTNAHQSCKTDFLCTLLAYNI